MSDTAQNFQRILTETIQKQMTILGPQITLLKVRNISGLSVADNGTVINMSGNPQAVITQFLEQFRDLSAPLVRKTMQPLLSEIGSLAKTNPSVAPAEIKKEEDKNDIGSLVPKTSP